MLATRFLNEPTDRPSALVLCVTFPAARTSNRVL